MSVTPTPPATPVTPQPTSSFNFSTVATTTVIPLLTVIGLIVLMALRDITWAEAGPLLAAIVGVHGGAVVANASK